MATFSEGEISCLQKILSELELLTASTKANAIIRFQQQFLTSNQQRNIYAAFDGERDAQAIADETSAALRSVQLLISDLQKNDLIDVVKRGHSSIPQKSIAKIATYYARLDISSAGR